MNFCLDRWGTVYAFILCGQHGSESEAKIQAWLLKFLFVLLQFIKAEYHLNLHGLMMSFSVGRLAIDCVYVGTVLWIRCDRYYNER